ncbi:MAG: cell division protein FtsZ [Hyphomicrobiaceae bacterium]|nr:MAG: cell division protein FtsZ [Hyphomicrobiaceae bacterium]
MPDLLNTKPRIVVIGVGGAGGNAINNMVGAGLAGVHFVAANTDMQALAASKAEHRIQLGSNLTEGLGAGSKPEIGEAAAEEALEEISAQIADAHMVFIAAGMGGGTGTGAAYVIARVAKELGILTIAVVTKPFQFEGSLRMRNAEAGIAALGQYVDTLLVIPNENLFRVATDRTTFAEAFVVADQVLYSGIATLVDLILEEGLINLDLADVKAVLSGMGAAMMGMGEASGEQRAIVAAEEAIVNPLLDDVTLKGAKSLLLSITGGRDLTLWEVDEAANRIRQEVDPDANIIVGATLDESLDDKMRVSIVASGMPNSGAPQPALEVDAPVWTPRYQRIDGAASGPELFGRRLTEAIIQRDAQGKPRAGQKGRGRGRSAQGDAARKKEGVPKLPGQPPVARGKRGQAAKSRGPSLEPRFPPAPDRATQTENRALVRRPPAADASAAVGWPEHWARAGEAVASGEPVTVRPAEPSVVPLRQPEAPPRKATLFQRLAGLVAAKREA